MGLCSELVGQHLRLFGRRASRLAGPFENLVGAAPDPVGSLSVQVAPDGGIAVEAAGRQQVSALGAEASRAASPWLPR